MNFRKRNWHQLWSKVGKGKKKRSNNIITSEYKTNKFRNIKVDSKLFYYGNEGIGSEEKEEK